MKTEYFNTENPDSLDNVVNLLLSGEVIAFPTETVYGLGVCYNSKEALYKLYTIKKRLSSKPIAICLDHYENIKKIAQKIPEEYWKIAKRFFPGPLTIIFSSGKTTLGIRVPENRLCQQIIKRTGPLYVTSANYSNHKDIIDSLEVYKTFQGVIAGVITENKKLKYNKCSTVIQIQESNKIKLVREGPISLEAIQACLS